VILKTKLGVHAVITAERMADSQPINEDISDLTSHLWYESFSWIDGFKKEKENQVMSHATGAAHDTLESEDVFLGKASRESMVDPNLLSAHWNVAWTVAHSLRESDQDEAKVEEYSRELLEQIRILYDIFGTTFRPVLIDTDWLAWNSGYVKRLAQGFYDSRDFSAMLILADVLEDAGCTEAALLDHLRGPGPHVRGCWALDLLLGKE